MPSKAFAAAAALTLSLAALPAAADGPPPAPVAKPVVREQPRRVTRTVVYRHRHVSYRARAWDGRYGLYPRRHFFVDGFPTSNPFGSSFGVIYGGWTYYTPGPAVVWYPAYGHAYRHRPFCDCY